MGVSILGTAYADNPWTGFYAGIDAGVIFNNVQLKSQQLGFTNPSDTCNTSSDILTFSPGLQLGYMYQFSNDLVSGIEVNTTFNTHQDNTLSCNSNINSDVYDRFTFKNQMQTSMKGRVGRAFDYNANVLLPYLTTGASFANVGLTYQNEGGDYYSKHTTRVGWLIGAGIEWAFKKHWSVRTEYSYVDYGNTIKLNIPAVYGLFDSNGNGRAKLSSNDVAISINYWF